ncbi:MAG TPA: hypothetical protein VGI66_12495 [Streptosporangiaceae bacterium]
MHDAPRLGQPLEQPRTRDNIVPGRVGRLLAERNDAIDVQTLSGN